MIKKKLSRIEDFISPTCFSYQTNTFRYSYKLPFTPILYTKKHDNSFYFLYNIICTKLRFLRGAKLCDTPREVLNARVCVASRMPRECEGLRSHALRSKASECDKLSRTAFAASEASESLLMPCYARQANAVCKPSRSESLLRKPNSRLPRYARVCRIRLPCYARHDYANPRVARVCRIRLPCYARHDYANPRVARVCYANPFKITFTRFLSIISKSFVPI